MGRGRRLPKIDKESLSERDSSDLFNNLSEVEYGVLPVEKRSFSQINNEYRQYVGEKVDQEKVVKKKNNWKK